MKSNYTLFDKIRIALLIAWVVFVTYLAFNLDL
jgi:hypothetical protein